MSVVCGAHVNYALNMDATGAFMDLIVRRGEGDLFVGTTVTADPREPIELQGQTTVAGVRSPASITLAPSEDRDLLRATYIRSVLVDEEELVVAGYDAITHSRVSERDEETVGGRSQIELHTLCLRGEESDIRVTAVVDPLPLVIVLGAGALAAYLISRETQRKEMKTIRAQWERDERDCLEQGGLPQSRINGSAEYDWDTSRLALRLKTQITYEFSCLERENPPAE